MIISLTKAKYLSLSSVFYVEGIVTQPFKLYILAQISKVQQFSSTSTTMMPASTEQPTNGILVASTSVPQVFDYGHQSSSNFARQNSCPATTNGNKAGSGSNKYSSYNKTPPPTGNSVFTGSNNVAQNGPTSFSNFRDMSPSGWSNKVSGNNVGGNNKYPSSSRKHFNKQFSHKY